jgi:hypothetical protein
LTYSFSLDGREKYEQTLAKWSMRRVPRVIAVALASFPALVLAAVSCGDQGPDGLRGALRYGRQRGGGVAECFIVQCFIERCHVPRTVW